MAQITIDYQEYLHLLECKAKKDSLTTVIQVKHVSTGLLVSHLENKNAEEVSEFIKNVEESYDRTIKNYESELNKLRVDSMHFEVKCNVLEAKLKSIPNWIKRIFI